MSTILTYTCRKSFSCAPWGRPRFASLAMTANWNFVRLFVIKLVLSTQSHLAKVEMKWTCVTWIIFHSIYLRRKIIRYSLIFYFYENQRGRLSIRSNSCPFKMNWNLYFFKFGKRNSGLVYNEINNCKYDRFCSMFTKFAINLEGIINLYLLSERTHLRHGRSSSSQVLTTVMQGRVFIQALTVLLTPGNLTNNNLEWHYIFALETFVSPRFIPGIGKVI